MLKLRVSSARLISEGQNHLVDVEDCFPATVRLLRTVEEERGWGWDWGGLAEEKR